MKTRVELIICSRNGNEEETRRTEGEWYVKGDGHYLRYREEESEMGKTVTIIRVKEDSIKIIRQGDVRSEQEFVPLKKRVGYYSLPKGRLSLETFTRTMDVRWKDGEGSLSWSYDLAVSGSPAGRCRLDIAIRPIPDGNCEDLSVGQ